MCKVINPLKALSEFPEPLDSRMDTLLGEKVRFETIIRGTGTGNIVPLTAAIVRTGLDDARSVGFLSTKLRNRLTLKWFGVELPQDDGSVRLAKRAFSAFAGAYDREIHISMIGVLDAFSEQDIGAQMIEDVLNLLGSERTLLTAIPHPLRFTTDGFENLSDHPNAAKRLRNAAAYFKHLGFEHLGAYEAVYGVTSLTGGEAGGMLAKHFLARRNYEHRCCAAESAAWELRDFMQDFEKSLFR